VTRSELEQFRTFYPALYALYGYCYEGLAADKIELAQQFLSLTVKDLASLCERAAEVRDATRKSYSKALVERVARYFDAREKVQQRIGAAISETITSVTGMSRDLSGDLYKVAGILAAATAGALLDSSITTWAALLAAAVIAVYAGIVLAYHLPTLQRAFALRMKQHRAYIRSFELTLTAAEIEGYLADPRVAAAQALFDEKYARARHLYIAFLVLALLVVLLSIILLLAGAGIF
jgi:hypothetical protein